VSTSAIDTWQTVNIRTENVIEVLKWFLPLNSGTTYVTNENSSTKFKKAENSGTNKIFNPNFNTINIFQHQYNRLDFQDGKG
jgi:hypothetical protein